MESDAQLVSSEFPIGVRLGSDQETYLATELGLDRLSAWPIIGADIKHFTDYRYRPFSKQICR